MAVTGEFNGERERSRCPVTRHEDVNEVAVTSCAGVKEMLRDFRSFSNRLPGCVRRKGNGTGRPWTG
jgi:hypothetical protein